jgi:hypothetical protein
MSSLEPNEAEHDLSLAENPKGARSTEVTFHRWLVRGGRPTSSFHVGFGDGGEHTVSLQMVRADRAESLRYAATRW